VVAYGKSGRSEAALRGLRAAERLGEPYRHDRDRHPDDGDDVDDGRLVRPEQVVEDPYRQGGRALSERIDMEKSALETDRPGRVVLHGLLDLRPTLPLERIAMGIDEAVARALAASGYGPRYRRPDWTTRPLWAMSSSLCDRSAKESTASSDT
jgi:hypothetical protein